MRDVCVDAKTKGTAFPPKNDRIAAVATAANSASGFHETLMPDSMHVHALGSARWCDSFPPLALLPSSLLVAQARNFKIEIRLSSWKTSLMDISPGVSQVPKIECVASRKI